MNIEYSKKKNILTVRLGRNPADEYTFEKGDFKVSVDEDDNLIKIVVANAAQFLTDAVAAGVVIKQDEKSPAKPKQGMVWFDADSSMISAFGYNEEEQFLDVAFHRTGVYRYFDVPPDVFEGLRDASSQGSYMRNYIIDMYDYEKKRGR